MKKRVIYTPSLEEARHPAAIVATGGHTVYIYQLDSGAYWLTLLLADSVTG
jgi:hypothetical protein